MSRISKPGNQLRIIAAKLPLRVKAVLEESSDKYKQVIYERALKNIGLDFPCWVAQDNLEYGIEYISLSKRVENLREVLKSFKEKEEKVEKDNDRN